MYMHGHTNMCTCIVCSWSRRVERTTQSYMRKYTVQSTNHHCHRLYCYSRTLAHTHNVIIYCSVDGICNSFFIAVAAVVLVVIRFFLLRLLHCNDYDITLNICLNNSNDYYYCGCLVFFLLEGRWLKVKCLQTASFVISLVFLAKWAYYSYHT